MVFGWHFINVIGFICQNKHIRWFRCSRYVFFCCSLKSIFYLSEFYGFYNFEKLFLKNLLCQEFYCGWSLDLKPYVVLILSCFLLWFKKKGAFQSILFKTLSIFSISFTWYDMLSSIGRSSSGLIFPQYI